MIHFISDLHLSDDQPHLADLFSCYLNQHTHDLSKLYILGDLFEVWIGDDYQPKWILSILQNLRTLHERGVQLYFTHGNRDFLVGNQFSELTGCRLLAEYQTIQLGNYDVLLCHGDSLCIDDTAYQTFRHQVRTKEWQTQFLSLPVEQRLVIVSDYRQQSQAATAKKNQDIMDVNNDEIVKVMHNFNIKHMIHGHTHRPNIHLDHSIFRLVLSDWREQGQFVSFINDSFSVNYFDLNNVSESSSHSLNCI